jgi:Spy/CpxP family protein refolding chaperone
MSRRLLSILLAVSAALNVSFLAGFLYVGRQLRALETWEGRAVWAARSLRLDDVQRQSFLRQSSAWRSQVEQVRREHQAEADAFWQEVVKDGADPAAVRARLLPLLETQRQAATDGVEHLLRVFDTLTPGQRQALVEMLRKKERF